MRDRPFVGGRVDIDGEPGTHARHEAFREVELEGCVATGVFAERFAVQRDDGVVVDNAEAKDDARVRPFSRRVDQSFVPSVF